MIDERSRCGLIKCMRCTWHFLLSRLPYAVHLSGRASRVGFTPPRSFRIHLPATKHQQQTGSSDDETSRNGRSREVARSLARSRNRLRLGEPTGKSPTRASDLSPKLPDSQTEWAAFTLAAPISLVQAHKPKGRPIPRWNHSVPKRPPFTRKWPQNLGKCLQMEAAHSISGGRRSCLQGAPRTQRENQFGCKVGVCVCVCQCQ